MINTKINSQKQDQYVYFWLPNKPQTLVMLKQNSKLFPSSASSSSSSSPPSSTYVIWITTNPSSSILISSIADSGIELGSFDNLAQAIKSLQFQKQHFIKNNVKIQFWCDDFSVMKDIDQQGETMKEFGVENVWFYQLNNQGSIDNDNEEYFNKLKPNLKLSKQIQYDYGKLQKILSKNNKMFNFVFLNDADQTNLMLYSLHAMINQQTNRQQIINYYSEICSINIPQSKDQVEQLRNQYKNINYQSLGQQILFWYKKQSFFYRSLNSILRSCKDPTQLFYVQPFVSDLYNFIKDCHQNKNQNQKGINKNNDKNKSQLSEDQFYCYRGGFSNQDEIKSMKNRKNEIIQSLGFMSASTNIDKAREFMKNCLFQIKVSNKNKLKQYEPGYLHWHNFPILLKQKQILFNILTSFTLQQIQQKTIQGKNVYVISLTYGSIQTLMYNFKHQQQQKITKQQKCLANVRKFHHEYTRYSMNQSTAIQKLIYCNSKIAWKYSIKQQEIINEFQAKNKWQYQQNKSNICQWVKYMNLKINNYYRMFKIKWTVLEGLAIMVIVEKCREFYKENKNQIMKLLNKDIYQDYFNKFVQQLTKKHQFQLQNKELQDFINNALPFLNQQQQFQTYIKNKFEKQCQHKQSQKFGNLSRDNHYQTTSSNNNNINNNNINNNNNNNNKTTTMKHGPTLRFQQIIDFTLVIQKYAKMLASSCQLYKNYCNIQKILQLKQQFEQISTIFQQIKPVQLFQYYFYQSMSNIFNYYLKYSTNNGKSNNQLLSIQLINKHIETITNTQQYLKQHINSHQPQPDNKNTHYNFVFSILNNDYQTIQNWIGGNLQQIQYKIQQGHLETQTIQSKIFAILVRSQYNDNTQQQIDNLQKDALKLTQIIDRYYGHNTENKFLCIGMLNSIYYRKQKLIQIIELAIKQCQHNIFSFNLIQQEEQQYKNVDERDFVMRIKYVIEKFKNNQIKDGLDSYKECFNLPKEIKNEYRVRQMYMALTLLACGKVIEHCSMNAIAHNTNNNNTNTSANTSANSNTSNNNNQSQQYKFVYEQCWNLQIIKQSCQKALIFIKTLIAYVSIDHTWNPMHSYPFLIKSIGCLEYMMALMRTSSIFNVELKFVGEEEFRRILYKRKKNLMKFVQQYCVGTNTNNKTKTKTQTKTQILYNKLTNEQKSNFTNNFLQSSYFIQLAQIIKSGVKNTHQIPLLDFAIKLSNIKIKLPLNYQNQKVIKLIQSWLKETDNFLFLLNQEAKQNGNINYNYRNCQQYQILYLKKQRLKLINLLQKLIKTNLENKLIDTGYLQF